MPDPMRSQLTTRLRDLTLAAYSIGYSVVLAEEPPDNPWEPWKYRCTWRRSGPLGAGQYRELSISPDVLTRASRDQLLNDVIGKQLIRPLIGDDIAARIVAAADRLKHGALRAAPVECFGGPRDGYALTVKADGYGFPADDLLQLPPEPEPVTWAMQATAPTEIAILRPLLYRRGPLDEQAGVWRFDFMG